VGSPRWNDPAYADTSDAVPSLSTTHVKVKAKRHRVSHRNYVHNLTRKPYKTNHTYLLVSVVLVLLALLQAWEADCRQDTQLMIRWYDASRPRSEVMAGPLCSAARMLSGLGMRSTSPRSILSESRRNTHPVYAFNYRASCTRMSGSTNGIIS
jgi:hypothetical protein